MRKEKIFVDSKIMVEINNLCGRGKTAKENSLLKL